MSAELKFSVNVHPSDDPWDVLPSLATAPFVDGRLPHTRILSPVSYTHLRAHET